MSLLGMYQESKVKDQMKFIKYKTLLLLAIFMIGVFSVGVNTAFAAPSRASDFASNPEAQLVPVCENDQCQWKDLLTLANNIINFLVFASSIFGVLAFCYAGFLYLTAAGNSGQVEKAHGVFKMALIGIITILCGWLLIATILKILVGDGDAAGIRSFIDFRDVETLDKK